LLFHPYLMGERTPLNAPNAAGSFYGLNLRHDRGHLVRACLEGVACGLAEALELVRGLGVEVRGVRLIGGGARSTLWTSIVADVLGLPVRRLAAEEGPAFGAALLAGVGAGVSSDLDQACATAVRVGPLREPDPQRVEQYSELLERWRALRGRLAPLYRG